MIADWILNFDEKVAKTVTTPGEAKRGINALSKVVEIDIEALKFQVAGQDVQLYEGDIFQSQCNCRNPKTCFHILAAAFYVKENVHDETESNSPAEPFNMLAIADVEAVMKFAGKQYSLAKALSKSPCECTIDSVARVRFVEHEEEVHFLSDSQLKTAIYKGTRKTRDKLVIAAGALVLLAKAGIESPEEAISATVKVELADLSHLVAQLELAFQFSAGGARQEAGSILFEASLRARSENSYRLAAELNNLSKSMRIGAQINAMDQDWAWFLSLSRSFALLATLILSGHEKYGGSLHRDYVEGGTQIIQWLGAWTWKNPSGASGLSLYGCAPDQHQFFEAAISRETEFDRNFSPELAYHSQMLFQISTPEKMIGQTVQFNELRIANGQRLALVQNAHLTDSKICSPSLGQSITDFSSIREYLRDQIGSGLRQNRVRQPLLLKPSQLLKPEWSELYQQCWLTIVDQDHQALHVIMPEIWRVTLSDWLNDVEFVLVLYHPNELVERRFEIAAIWLNGWEKPFLAQFSSLPTRGRLSKFVSNFKQSRSTRNLALPESNLPIRKLLIDIAELLPRLMSIRSLEDKVREKSHAANELGLSQLSSAINQYCDKPNATQALKIGYMIDELMAYLDPYLGEGIDRAT